ncbi:DUF2768 family protein [Paenibacillus sp. y28]|uniref:DUF2768 family protein n=1 Tax=Paenibacillus sp. y28 TaxID=3129110 RepID=UPI00301B415B
MSSMDKMWASFIAMGLMVLSSFIISYARSRNQRVFRWVLSIVAYLMLLVSILYMITSLL